MLIVALTSVYAVSEISKIYDSSSACITALVPSHSLHCEGWLAQHHTFLWGGVLMGLSLAAAVLQFNDNAPYA
jgi:hypothetical protein